MHIGSKENHYSGIKNIQGFFNYTFLKLINLKKNMKAIWNNQILAESDNTVVIEGNHYFPPESLNKSFFKSSELHTTCPWKGQASYYTITVDGKENKDAAWYYTQPSELAKAIKNHVAFWRGVEVVK